MTRRLPRPVALVVGLWVGAIIATSAVPVSAAVPPAPPQTIDTWAFCGVKPDDPDAATAVRAMAQIGGIDATFGPCNIPTPDYSPAHSANRYVDFQTYMQLVLLNATVGMKTVVRDDRIWSTDANVRQTAIGFWTPVLSNIAAWDMGDEFDPADPVEWGALKSRWKIVHDFVEPVTNVQPFANFRPTTLALDMALTDLQGVGRLLSFDQYIGDHGVSLAQSYNSRAAKLMCAVNTIEHNGLAPTSVSIRTEMDTFKTAGCDQILVFTGFPVYQTPTQHVFADSSVVDTTGVATDRAAATQEGSGHSSIVPIRPIRLLETRSGPGLGTFDSGFNATGPLRTDNVFQLGVAGRLQIPASVRSVLLNVTVTGATGPGFLTVYPCDQTRPTSSNLNYDVGVTRAVAVVAQIGSSGAVCVYTQTQADVIVDLTGYYSVGSAFSAIQPARLLETRAGDGISTVDGQSLGIGRIPAGTTTEVKVAGRGGVPGDAVDATINLTAINPKAEGFATVFPCGNAIPLASTLNFAAGAIVPNAAMVKLGANGSICIFSNVETDMILDVNGYDAAQSIVRSFEPTRVLETRAGLTTADNLFQAGGARPADSVLELPIGGRLGVPTKIRAAVLNITVTEATAPGFVTVYPCDGTRPVASTLNYGKGTTVANLAVASTTVDGKVCIYTQTPTQLVVDLSGYHT